MIRESLLEQMRVICPSLHALLDGLRVKPF